MNTAEQPWLTEEEVQNLSGRKRRSHQRRALAELGIECRERWDGVNIVLRSALGAYDEASDKRTPSPGPDMSAI